MENYLRNSYPYLIKSSKSLSQEQKDKILEYMRTHRICGFCDAIYETTKSKGIRCCENPECKIKLKDKLMRIKKTREQNNLKKYGVKYFLNEEKRAEVAAKRTPEQKHRARQKAKETLKERYGDENYNNPKKSEQTKIEKYGSIENYKTHLSKVLKEAQIRVDHAKANEKRKLWRNSKIAEDPDFIKKQTLKNKQTKLERYGDENYNNIEKHKDTIRQRYGVENVSQIPGIQTKVRVTNIKKFGANHPMQTPEYQEKAKRTCIEKYGTVCAMQNIDIRNKARATCIEKYGVPYGTMTHLKNLENLNADFISKNFITKGILRFHEALEYFGYKSTVSPILGILDDAGIEYDIKRRCSVTETNFLDELSYFLGLDIRRQWRIKPFNFKADGYISNKNFKFKSLEFTGCDKVVIEFLGDYWHGKPNNSELTYFGESFADLHSKTFTRFDKIKSKGYRILYIWESDYAEHGISALKEY